jgi:hypothetical protein
MLYPVSSGIVQFLQQKQRLLPEEYLLVRQVYITRPSLWIWASEPVSTLTTSSTPLRIYNSQ